MSRRIPNRVRRGFTLPELTVGLAASAILAVGLSSSIFLSSSVLRQEESASQQATRADSILAQITQDTQAATEITELTTNAISMVVPDRNGDSNPETIRYAWSGTTGDPLTVALNGGQPITIGEDVQAFDLSYLSRIIAADSGLRILFISASSRSWFTRGVSPADAELAYLMLFDACGHEFRVASQHDEDGDLEKLANQADVVFVSQLVSSDTLNNKLDKTTTGIVCANYQLGPNFDLGDPAGASSGVSVLVSGDPHPITDGLPPKELVAVVSHEQYLTTLVDLRDSAQVLAYVAGEPSCVAMDVGRYDNRRMMLPWAHPDFDALTLTMEGKCLLDQALTWAAGM